MPYVEYQIKNVDLWEQDAILEIEGIELYFQFSRSDFGPTLRDALRYLKLNGEA